MLTVSCSLLLFLMCSSLHVCNARRDLGVLIHKKQQNHKLSHHDLHFFSKIQGEILIPKEKLGDQSQDQKQTRSQDLNKDRNIMEGKSLGNDVNSCVESKKSRASVKWRVPHRKRGEKQPGFNQDYSPPKTHPPSHN